ncbi:hypothetical protein AB4589_25410, partial [Vibrio sp. 10N.222.49.A3]
SARLAFWVWVKFSEYGGQIKCRGRVLHTLIGRYVSSLVVALILFTGELMYLFTGWNDYLASILKLDRSDKDYDMAHWLFWEYLFRKVPAQPRRIVLPPNFTLPAEIVAGFNFFKSYSELGKDLTPFMSKGVKRANNIDPLHSQWGVRHFHLGTKMEGEFASRTGPLLFTVVRDENIYVLGLWEHGDWVQKEILNVITDNWPFLIEKNKITEAEIVNLDDSPESLESSRKYKTSNALNLTDGNQYLFGTMTLSGHSMFSIMAYTHFIRFFGMLEFNVSKVLLSNFPFHNVKPTLSFVNESVYVLCINSGFQQDITSELYLEISRVFRMLRSFET